jgi:ATP-dependent Clp protease ATP-binding subunit ClpC
LGYQIELSSEAKDFIVEQGYDEKFGARPLKRAIQKFIEDPLAEAIINNSIQEGDLVTLGKAKDRDELTLEGKKPKGKKSGSK